MAINNNEFPVLAGIYDIFENNLFTITSQKIDAVTKIFMDWLSTEANLKRIPDLQQKIADMEPKLRLMTKNLKIKFEDGRAVITTDAASDTTLRLLRSGSSWFGPHPDPEAMIVAAMVAGSQVV
jgi:hypothetical protein